MLTPHTWGTGEVVSVRSELERDLYRFYFSDHPIRLVLQEYHLMTRKTKRHKFRTMEYCTVMVEVAIKYKNKAEEWIVHAIRNNETACSRSISSDGWRIEQVASEFNAVTCKECLRVLNTKLKKRMQQLPEDWAIKEVMMTTSVTEMLNQATELMEATIELISACDYTDIVYSESYVSASEAVVDVWNTFIPVGLSVSVTLKREGSRAVTISKARMFNGAAVVNIRFADSDVEATIRICELTFEST